jgi:hypothetical protein
MWVLVQDWIQECVVGWTAVRCHSVVSTVLYGRRSSWLVWRLSACEGKLFRVRRFMPVSHSSVFVLCQQSISLFIYQFCNENKIRLHAHTGMERVKIINSVFSVRVQLAGHAPVHVDVFIHTSSHRSTKLRRSRNHSAFHPLNCICHLRFVLAKLTIWSPLVILCTTILNIQNTQDSAVGIGTRYGMEGSRIESRCGRDFPHPSRPTQPRIKWVQSVLTRGKTAGAWH